MRIFGFFRSKASPEGVKANSPQKGEGRSLLERLFSKAVATPDHQEDPGETTYLLAGKVAPGGTPAVVTEEPLENVLAELKEKITVFFPGVTPCPILQMGGDGNINNALEVWEWLGQQAVCLGYSEDSPFRKLSDLKDLYSGGESLREVCALLCGQAAAFSIQVDTYKELFNLDDAPALVGLVLGQEQLRNLIIARDAVADKIALLEGGQAEESTGELQRLKERKGELDGEISAFRVRVPVGTKTIPFEFFNLVGDGVPLPGLVVVQADKHSGRKGGFKRYHFSVEANATKRRAFLRLQGLKRMRKKDKAQAKEEFQKEIALQRALLNGGVPHIPLIFAAGDDWVIMENFATSGQEYLKEFATVTDRREREPLALDWGKQVSETLIDMHKEGKLHRDLKPGNLLLGHRLAVADFGLASKVTAAQVRDETLFTASMQASRENMPPEIVAYELVGVPSDTFQHGVLLFEALRGEKFYHQAGDGVDHTGQNRMIEWLEQLRSEGHLIATDPTRRGEMVTFVAEHKARFAGWIGKSVAKMNDLDKMLFWMCFPEPLARPKDQQVHDFFHGTPETQAAIIRQLESRWNG